MGIVRFVISMVSWAIPFEFHANVCCILSITYVYLFNVLKIVLDFIHLFKLEWHT